MVNVTTIGLSTTVFGTLRDINGNPIYGGLVQLYYRDGNVNVQDASTDMNGNWSVTALTSSWQVGLYEAQYYGDKIEAQLAPAGDWELFEITGLVTGTAVGVTYRGLWQPNTFYNGNGNLRDIVRVQPPDVAVAAYYTSKSNHTSAATWTLDSGSWNAFSNNFASVATDLLFAQDVSVGRTITLGTDALNTGNFGILRSATALAPLNGNGFWIAGTADGSGYLRIGQATAASGLINGIFWNGPQNQFSIMASNFQLTPSGYMWANAGGFGGTPPAPSVGLNNDGIAIIENQGAFRGLVTRVYIDTPSSNVDSEGFRLITPGANTVVNGDFGTGTLYGWQTSSTPSGHIAYSPGGPTGNEALFSSDLASGVTATLEQNITGLSRDTTYNLQLFSKASESNGEHPIDIKNIVLYFRYNSDPYTPFATINLPGDNLSPFGYDIINFTFYTASGTGSSRFPFSSSGLVDVHITINFHLSQPDDLAVVRLHITNVSLTPYNYFSELNPAGLYIFNSPGNYVKIGRGHFEILGQSMIVTNLQVNSSLTVGGNLTVYGNYTLVGNFITTGQTIVSSPIQVLNYLGSLTSPVTYAGIELYNTSGNAEGFIFDPVANWWFETLRASGLVGTQGSVTASYVRRFALQAGSGILSNQALIYANSTGALLSSLNLTFDGSTLSTTAGNFTTTLTTSGLIAKVVSVSGILSYTNIVVNPTIAANANDWNVGGDWQYNVSIGGLQHKAFFGDGASTQFFPLVPGGLYTVTLRMRGRTAGTFQAFLGGTSITGIVSANQTYNATVIAGSSVPAGISLTAWTIDFDGTIDNVYVSPGTGESFHADNSNVLIGGKLGILNAVDGYVGTVGPIASGQIPIAVSAYNIVSSTAFTWDGTSHVILPTWTNGAVQYQALSINATGTSDPGSHLGIWQYNGATEFSVDQLGNTFINGNVSTSGIITAVGSIYTNQYFFAGASVKVSADVYWDSIVAGTYRQSLTAFGNGGYINPGTGRSFSSLYISDVYGEATTPHGLVIIHRTGPVPYSSPDNVGALKVYMTTNASSPTQVHNAHGVSAFVDIGNGIDVPGYNGIYAPGVVADGIEGGVNMYASGLLPIARGVNGSILILGGDSNTIIVSGIGLGTDVFSATNGAIWHAYSVFARDQVIGTLENAALRFETTGMIDWNNDTWMWRSGVSALTISGLLTITGATLINNTATVSGLLSVVTAGLTAVFGNGTGNSQVQLLSSTGAVGDLQFKKNTGLRWLLRNDGTAETGSNTGSDFSIQSRSDGGGGLYTPASFERDTGHVYLVGQAGKVAIGKINTLGFNQGYPVATLDVTGSGIFSTYLTVGSWLDVRAPIYGELWADNNAYGGSSFNVSLVTTGTAYTLSGVSISGGINNQVTLAPASGNMTILISGIYDLSYSISFSIDSSNIVSHYSVFKNGIEVPGSSIEATNINSTDVVAVSKKWLVNCAANDVLDIRADCSSSGRILTVGHYGFGVRKHN